MLKVCRHCKLVVLDTAKACPKCGSVEFQEIEFGGNDG